ncbi:DUF262 domain-containing protein [Massilia aquatica]|uniref:DUF262 domain-containing protein n=1 Tax=Massilia aquatica TaxID=2609000 RepID=A0ABX0M8S3_9BURK|nr:DUF262 domain-containing protein [Massilia aquatica]NHZ38571.1 DUF262 domain-containing protein [Massilia aquatica]
MTKTLTAHEQAISKIFSDDYIFTIPGYQRPYSWKVEQASELVEDLLGFMRSSIGELSELPPYFLGSIVLVKAETQPDATVVDGQQRLTTLTLLLSAIRAHAENGMARAGISKMIYDQGDIILNTENHYRLTLRSKDEAFFQDYVQHEGGVEKLVSLNSELSDSQNRLRDNAKFYMKYLSKIGIGEQLRLAQFIATRCYLVAVSTPDLDSAFRIFNVLNSRGLDLSATDILKAEITGKISEKIRPIYTQMWEELEEDLGRDEFNDLFGHIRTVYRKIKPQETLLKEFRVHVKFAKAEQFIDEILKPMAVAFQEIGDSSYTSQQNAEKVNASLTWINKVEFRDWMPPTLTYFVRHRNDFDLILRFVSDMEILVYSMLIRRVGVNDRIDRFSKLTTSIEAGEDLWASKSPLALSPVEQYSTYEALSGPIYDTHSARAVSLILVRLDSLLSGGGAIYSYNTISVEHILPQTPMAKSQWLEWIPEAEKRRALVHRLGNLALLTRRKNSAARNFDFAKKKTAYFTKNGISPFVLTTQVLAAAAWTEEVILARQDVLLSKFEQHYRLQDRKSPSDAMLAAIGG